MDSPGKKGWDEYVKQVESYMNEYATGDDIVLTQEELLDIDDLYRSGFTADKAAALLMTNRLEKDIAR